MGKKLRSFSFIRSSIIASLLLLLGRLVLMFGFVFFLLGVFAGKVHGSLARAGKVRGQTPKVAKQDKKKKPRGRAHKRMQYNRRFVTAGMWFLSKLPKSLKLFLLFNFNRLDSILGLNIFSGWFRLNFLNGTFRCFKGFVKVGKFVGSCFERPVF